MDSRAEDVSKVYNLIMAAWGSQAVRAIASLSVAEHLADGPLTADDIAGRESADSSATYRLLRAGVALGLLGQDAGTGAFRSTSALEVLHQDNDSSLKHYAKAAIGPVFWLPAVRLPDAVRDGQPQTVAALGVDTFGYFGQHRRDAAEFGAAMTGLSAPVIRDAVSVIEPGEAGTVVDVGGAEGAFAAELLARHPWLSGVVLERPALVPQIAAEAKRRGLSDRLEAVPGDFFASVPHGDIYLLKFILHDWDDDSCVRILSAIAAAMAPGARLYIVEMLADGTRVPPGLAYMDMAMLFGLGGQERSVAAFDELLRRAGLKRTALRPLLEPYAAIEASRAREGGLIATDQGIASSWRV
jgi:O-methyltransferase domain/Dimerisation domain